MVCIYAVSIAAAFYPFTYASQSFAKLDSDLKHIATTVLVAATGGSLFFIRNKTRERRFLEIIEMLELMILIIIPSLEIVTYLTKNPSNWYFATSPFFGGAILWYVIVFMRHKTFENTPRAEQRFGPYITYLFLMFMLIGTVATWILLMFLPYAQYKG